MVYTLGKTHVGWSPLFPPIGAPVFHYKDKEYIPYYQIYYQVFLNKIK